jgi:hypothetical protein
MRAAAILMIVRRLLVLSALAVLIGAGVGGCGGQAGDDTKGESVVVIHVYFEVGVPTVNQIRVNAHLGGEGVDSGDLFFPTAPRSAIPSGSTLALVIAPTHMGLLDLIVYGLDASQNPVARGNGQTMIKVGERVGVTITLQACSSSGPGSGC